MIPLATYPDALPPDKPAMVAVADSWNADTLNIDLLTYSARLILPTQAGGDLNAIVDLTAIIQNTNPLELYSEGLRIDSIRGTPAVSGYGVENNILSVNFVSPPTPGDTVALHIVYRAPNNPSIADVGYHSLSDIAFSFNEPQGARRWLPIHDTPRDRFAWSIAVTPPPGWIAVSNGIRRVDTTSTPVTTVHSLVSYLAQFTAANFHTWDTTAVTPFGTHLPIRYYARPENEAMARVDWVNTPRMIYIFSSLYGDYPFPNDGYGMVEAPIMGGSGAMEHLAMSTIGSALLSGDHEFDLVYAHELSHQWFGDAVTPLAFRDIWLNEGFATFSEGMYLEQIGDSTGAVEHRKQNAAAYIGETQRTIFPLTDPPDNNLFSTAVYSKGAWVLQMARRRLGDSTFFFRMQTYFANNQSHPVTSADFIYAMSDGGNDITTSAFLHEWLEQPGHPIIRWQSTPVAGGVHIVVQQKQTSHTFTTGIPLWFQDGETTISCNLMQASQEFDLPGVRADSVRLVWHDDALYELQPTPDATIRPVAHSAVVTSYPNPGRNSVAVKISLSLPGVTNGQLQLFDVLGRRVYSTRLTKLGTGERLVVPTLSHLAPGTYFWRFDAGSLRAVRQIVIE